MPLTFNGQAIENVMYNGAQIKTLKYNGETVFEYVEPVKDLYPLETKCFQNTYNTYATSINNNNAQIGRAVNPNTSEDGHMGVFVKVPLPTDWSNISTMKLHLYRKSGSAAAATNFGTFPASWTDSLSFVTIWNVSKSTVNADNRIEASLAGNEGWNVIDISSLKSRFIANKQEDYFILTIMSSSAYAFVDADITGSTRMYIEVT